MKKLIILLLLVMLLTFFTGCKKEAVPTESETIKQEAEAEETEEGITFTDDLEREVTVSNPQRVAALLGSYADIWYLAGGTICASADDAWEDFDLPLTEDVVNLGMTKELSLEKLLEADPDFVLASSNTKGNVDWMDTLEAAGITTAYFGVSNFEDYLRMLKYCTDITGRQDLYQKNGLDLQEKIREVVEKSKERIGAAGTAPTVLSLRASSTYIRAKSSHDNVLGEMLKALGCINIADQDDSLLENLSVEHILEQDPDYIFIVQQGDDEEGTRTNMNHFIADNPAWSELSAVKEDRVYFMEKALYSLKPNNRWGEAYEKLEEILKNEQKQN
ncbi:MAG: ABC transporter substrate-binding protein [Lachnospiraceae bacterium]